MCSIVIAKSSWEAQSACPPRRSGRPFSASTTTPSRCTSKRRFWLLHPKLESMQTRESCVLVKCRHCRPISKSVGSRDACVVDISSPSLEQSRHHGHETSCMLATQHQCRPYSASHSLCFSCYTVSRISTRPSLTMAWSTRRR